MQMTDPLVTIILTVFKRTEYLEEAIRSVLQQTFESFEILVTDDANQAQTRAICDKFASDGRVRYRMNPTTLGAPLNIAAAFRESRGKYISIFNDDDLLAPQMLERLVAPLEQRPDVVLSFGNYKIVDRAGGDLPVDTAKDMRARSRVGLVPGLIERSFDFALRRGVMVVFSCVFRKTACDPDGLVAEVAESYDYWMPIKISTQGPFYFIPEIMMSWRQHENSVSATISKNIFAADIFIYREMTKLPLDDDLREHLCNCLANGLYLLGRAFLLQGWDRTEARGFLVESLKTNIRFAVLSEWFLSFFPQWIRCHVSSVRQLMPGS